MLRSRWALALVVAIGALCAVSGSATATNLSVLNRTFRITWSPMNIIPVVGPTIRCPVTLEGSFHGQTFAKTASNSIASVTSQAIGACTGGTIALLRPNWTPTLQYVSFSGTLPTISTISFDLEGIAAEWDGWFGYDCLYLAAIREPSGLRFVRNTTTGQITLVDSLLRRIDEFFNAEGCPAIYISGNGAMTVAGGFEGVFFSLA